VSESKAKQLGTYVRRARLAKDLSLRGLADMIGVSFSAIRDLEAGRFREPRPAKLAKLARALEVPVEDLYTIVGYTMPEGLPEFGPYLRTKYELSSSEIKQLNKLFEDLAAKKKGGRRG